MWDVWGTMRKPNLWIMDKGEELYDKGIEKIFSKTTEENSQI